MLHNVVKIGGIELLLSKVPQNSNVAEEILTVSQASEFLNLAVATIYSKVSRNEIPVNKQGKKLYFYKSELIDWIRSGRIKTNDEMIKAFNFQRKV
nr:helix-turn-helix domain-containing protein [Flavobacterium sp. Sd200]